MFIAALFIIVKIWQQPKYLSTDGWIKMGTHTHTHTQDINHKKNEMLPFATTWMDLEGITLSEVNQRKKDKYYMLLFICGI